MSGFLWNFASFVVALGILVAVHEFGHFWVARRCGVKVHKFSIGFGKSIWSRTDKQGTEYTIALIPLGGFVKMLDGRVDELTDEQKNQAFDHKPLWKRSAIVAAGPMFNFLFAIIAYWLVLMIGVPSVKPVIGDLVPNSIAEQAGIERSMELTSIDGIKTPDWQSVNMQLISHIGLDQMSVTYAPIDNYGLERQTTLDIRQWQFDPEKESAIRTIGIVPYRPEIISTVSQVIEGGAAEAAGVQVGDQIIGLNEQPMTEWEAIAETIRNNPSTAMPIDIIRDGNPITLTLTPNARVIEEQTIGYVGIMPTSEPWPENYRFDMQFGPFAAIGEAVNKSYQLVDLTLSMLKKLVVGHVGIENLSGPISIAKGAGATADYGLVHFLMFLALISVNLGIINLLPLPVLDGGHLLFFAIEAVIRRPVPEKVQEVGYRIGGALLLALMTVAIFNDFMRL
ncbi:sigma E protease regulator RseP [Vibrio ulleungensis]|uniref:Zinc metalloprotease n=1 Tax=Vibrio ulleungensis TaxID=2807619 RepID=A0ABS2HPX7_9VIBR|nr:sigma E protease regulator RseP [Vibrio ulleungensis]MBM7038162.1 sigma E protease regulator RseP [Vibrio ulleungensis]